MSGRRVIFLKEGYRFMANKVEKTNVMRVLDKAEIPYQTHFYSPDTGIEQSPSPRRWDRIRRRFSKRW